MARKKRTSHVRLDVCDGCKETTQENGEPLKFSKKHGRCTRCVSWIYRHAAALRADPNHMTFYNTRVTRAVTRHETIASEIDSWIRIRKAAASGGRKGR